MWFLGSAANVPQEIGSVSVHAVSEVSRCSDITLTMLHWLSVSDGAVSVSPSKDSINPVSRWLCVQVKERPRWDVFSRWQHSPGCRKKKTTHSDCEIKALHSTLMQLCRRKPWQRGWASFSGEDILSLWQITPVAFWEILLLHWPTSDRNIPAAPWGLLHESTPNAAFNWLFNSQIMTVASKAMEGIGRRRTDSDSFSS